MNKISKLWLLMMCLVLISFTELTFVNAEQTFQQDIATNFKIQCIINGTYCTASAICNLTIQYPNATILVNNAQMLNQISFYNYTLNNLSALGKYTCSATCCDSGFCGTNDCSFSITPSGDSNSLGFTKTIKVQQTTSKIQYYLNWTSWKIESKAITSLVYTTKDVEQKQLKKGMMLDKDTGLFYKEVDC